MHFFHMGVPQDQLAIGYGEHTSDLVPVAHVVDSKLASELVISANLFLQASEYSRQLWREEQLESAIAEARLIARHRRRVPEPGSFDDFAEPLELDVETQLC